MAMCQKDPLPVKPLEPIWRDLLCLQCNQVSGFTRNDLPDDYRFNYWCQHCQEFTDRVFTGTPFAIDYNDHARRIGYQPDLFSEDNE